MPRNGQSQAKRVFDLDMQHCPNCGGSGELKIIAAMLERP